jgi:hypothetical protein
MIWERCLATCSLWNLDTGIYDLLGSHYNEMDQFDNEKLLCVSEVPCVIIEFVPRTHVGTLLTLRHCMRWINHLRFVQQV